MKPEEVEAAIAEGKKKMKLELGVSENLSKKLRQEQELVIKLYNDEVHEREKRQRDAER